MGIKKAAFKSLRYIRSCIKFCGKKTVCFYGAFGHGNLGDDAAFISGKNMLNTNIVPLSKRLYSFRPHAIKVLFIGGGGIFHWDSPYIPRMLLKRKQWHFPVIILSGGINCDYCRKFEIDAVNKIKKLCYMSNLITVRDEVTRKFLLACGIKKEIKIIPDLALALKEEAPAGANFKKDSFTVGISLATHTEFTSRKAQGIKNIITQFVRHLVARGNRVVFLPFQFKRYDEINEIKVSKEIADEVGYKERIISLRNKYSPGQMLYIIKNHCDFILGMRLHANVFSANAGIPFLSLSYNIKHNAFLKMMELPQLNTPLLDSFSFDTLKGKFEEVMQDYDSIKDNIVRRRQYLVSVIKKEMEDINSRFLSFNSIH